MSQRDRIAQLNEIDTVFRIQNDRYGCNARIPDQSVRPMMSRIENEVVSEYEQNFSKNFETMDSNPIVDYLLPDYVPEFLPQDYKYITEEQAFNETKNIDREIEILVHILKQNLEKRLNKCNADIANIKAEYNANKNSMTEEKYLGKMALFEKTIEKIKKEIEQMKNKIQNLRNQKENYDTYINENNTKFEEINQHNLKEKELYLQLIKDLNGDEIDLEKRPDETEQQFVDRINQNASYANPDDQLLNAMNKVRSDFRTKMRELISNVAKIGQVEAGIEPFEKVDSKFEILKRWTIFKTKFIQIYGVDNKRVNATDIIDFMKTFLSGKDDIIYETHTKLTYKIDNESKTMTIFNNNSDGKMLFLRVLRVNSEEYALLYSLTGEPKSFKQYFDTKVPTDRKTKEVVSGKSSDEIEHFTGITVFKLMKLFGISTQALNINSFCKKITNTEYKLPLIDANNLKLEKNSYILHGKKEVVYGMGLKSEEIPNHCEFGDIRVLAKKLFHHNILSIRDKNGYSIKGYKPVKVSEQFVRLIMNLLNKIYPTQSDINLLKTGEKDVYNHIIHLANLTKTVPNQKDVSIQSLKKRYKLLEAEIEIGNNSPLVKQELVDVLHKLKDFKVITPTQLKNYLKQI